MIVHLVWFCLGGMLGMCALALFVIAKDSDRIGRPPRNDR